MFIKNDAIQFGQVPRKASVVISMFFLQFLSKSKRQEMILILKSHVDSGATLLVSEKVLLNDIKLDNIISRLHIAEKRKNFSDTEILDKDRQILDSMYIVTESQLIKELEQIGCATKVWQSYNFVGYVVQK